MVSTSAKASRQRGLGAGARDHLRHHVAEEVQPRHERVGQLARLAHGALHLKYR
jgi:hypothetical protein